MPYFVFCHTCKRRLDTTQSVARAESIRDAHEHDRVSWMIKPVDPDLGGPQEAQR